VLTRLATIPRAPLREIFGVDLRTLALFRVLLGGYLILDLGLRARDLVAHYTDFGVLTRADLAGSLSPGAFSLHMLNGTAPFQAALFVLAAIFALMLMLGWRTRLATIASWVLLLSLQNRNPIILSGEDQLVMVLTFWAMFLPLGARYSIDAALDKTSDTVANAYFSIATLALLIQGMSMYFFSALLKFDPIWIPDGTAVYYALNLDYIVKPFGLWLRQFAALNQGLTYYVWGLELIGPILMFSPILHRRLRAIVMIAFITMHIGFFLCLEIGIFPLISIIMNLTFMPGWMWDALAKKLRAARRDVEIWYDRDCEFCLKTCRILRTFLFLGDMPLRPAQDEPGVGALLEAHNSWVVRDDEGDHLKWNAMRRMVAASPPFRPLAWLLGVTPLRHVGDRFYDWVAETRSALSTWTSLWLPWRPVRVVPSRTGSIFAALALIFIAIQNISTVPATAFRLPAEFVITRQALGLYQFWTMFAPFPDLISPWPVIEGKLKNGAIVDVYNRAPGAPSFARPDSVAAVYPNYRWHKYLTNLEDQTHLTRKQVLAINYSKYLCRLWNRGTPRQDRLWTFTIYFNIEKTPPPGEPKRIETREVWSHDCFK
jgi:predicted DCC family thiol-disulfide oxidoreductase YuxK